MIQLSSRGPDGELLREHLATVPAVGEVAIPGGVSAHLILGMNADTALLAEIDGQAFDELTLSGQRVDSSTVHAIAHFQGLSRLHFWRCEFASDAFDKAPPIRKLCDLSVDAIDRDNNHQFTLMR